MCGRFHFDVLPDSKLAKKLTEITKKLNLVFSKGEIFPNSKVLCIIPKESKIDLTVKKWGIQNKKLQINAKIETIRDKSYYDSFKKNRCAIICNGFYEWDANKNKYYISFKEDYMYLACIFNSNNELLIITQESSEEFKKIHNRMPLVMNKEEMLSYIHGKDVSIQNKEFFIKGVSSQISLI